MAIRAEEVSKNKKGEGLLATGKADEPLFILRARDPLMPDLLERWADRLEELARHAAAPTTDAARGTQRKIASARGLARQARQWQAMNETKVPD